MSTFLLDSLGNTTTSDTDRPKEADHHLVASDSYKHPFLQQSHQKIPNLNPEQFNAKFHKEKSCDDVEGGGDCDNIDSPSLSNSLLEAQNEGVRGPRHWCHPHRLMDARTANIMSVLCGLMCVVLILIALIAIPLSVLNNRSVSKKK